MSEQLHLFNRFSRLRFIEAVPVYWELEGRLMRGKGHWSICKSLMRIMGEVYLHEMTVFHIKNYRAERKLENPQIRESTLNREHTRITRIINAFKEWKRVGEFSGYDFSQLQLPPDNPGQLVPKEDETRYQRNIVITPEMFRKFCDYAHPEVRRACTLAILTLQRRKDIRLLTDDNFNRAFDAISGTQSKTGNPYNVPTTLSVRVIFNQAKMEGRNYICDFTNWRRLFDRAKRESGIYFQFRDLRRSGATDLLLQGFDVVTVQRLLGHSSLDMTMTYLKPPAKASKEAAKSLETRYMAVMELPEYQFSGN